MAKNKIELTVSLGNPNGMPGVDAVKEWVWTVYGSLKLPQADVSPTRRTVRFTMPLPEDE